MKFYIEHNLDEYSDLIEQYFTHDVSTTMKSNIEEGKNTVELIPEGSKLRVTD